MVKHEYKDFFTKIKKFFNKSKPTHESSTDERSIKLSDIGYAIENGVFILKDPMKCQNDIINDLNKLAIDPKEIDKNSQSGKFYACAIS